MRARADRGSHAGGKHRGPSPPTPLPEGEGKVFIVYDPVLAASSGDALAGAGFVAAVRARLLPLVDCLTPNLPEAAALLGAAEAASEAEMVQQGRALLALGPRAVLMKGGHLDGAEAVDWLITAEDAQRFAAPRIASANAHGTGCTLSSAIAAHIVRGRPLPEAVAAAKAFVSAAIDAGREGRARRRGGTALAGAAVCARALGRTGSGAMTLAPLLAASPIIQVHAYLAFAAIALGAAQFALPKGVTLHRALGWSFALVMMGVAGGSLFIHTIRMWGPWSPIHLLSLFTLAMTPLAVLAARRGRIASHRSAMIWLYSLALVVTGLFTLWPGRIMHAVVFGP